MSDIEIDTPPQQVPRFVQPLRGKWDFLVRGWRPFGGWVCGFILLARGVVIPLYQLFTGSQVEPLDWVSLIALVGLLGIARGRTQERLAGVTG